MGFRSRSRLSVGILIAAGHVGWLWVIAVRSDLTDVVQIELTTGGIAAVLRIGVVTLTHHKLGPFSGGQDRFYLVVGSLALAYASSDARCLLGHRPDARPVPSALVP